MRAQLAATYDLMLDFSRAMSMEDVYQVLLKRCARYGVTSVLAGVIPKHIVLPADQPKYVVLGHWPAGWAQRYFEKQYVRRDPTIRHCAFQEEPLRWSEIDLTRNDQPEARIMNEAREFHLKDGITIPQLTLDGVRIGVSFSGERIDRSPEAVTALTVLAAYSVNRALQLRAALMADPVGLSPRERECLLWASEGKTAADIADLLMISEKAVEKYLSIARHKLDALTTAQAIASALRLGLLG